MAFVLTAPRACLPASPPSVSCIFRFVLRAKWSVPGLNAENCLCLACFVLSEHLAAQLTCQSDASAGCVGVVELRTFRLKGTRPC